MKKLLNIFIVFLILTCIGYAKNEEIKIIQKIEKKYNSIESIQAPFTQVYTAAGFTKGLKHEGKVFLQKGGKMRWKYTKPEKKDIISDGKTLWIYKEEDNDVISYDTFSEMRAASGLSFLWGEGKITSDFSYRYQGEVEKFHIFYLIPKKKLGETKSITIAVYRDDFLVHQVRILDNMGNENKIEFGKITLNKNFPNSLFVYKASTYKKAKNEKSRKNISE